ncbi:MAG: CBS domain-containing protein [Planctomycetes bacterium]|nr:CBS domain-containing protein [Planctomycetota bacterium]
MKIEELMTKSVATVSCDDTLEAAARQFWERDAGVVPVVDGRGVVVGMLTDRDVCIAAWTRGARLWEVRVADVMAKRVQVCWADDSPEVALELMVEQRVRRLPVVDSERRLLGLVSLCDLARSAAKDSRPATRERRLSRVGAALAEITRPHGEPAEATEKVLVPERREPAPLVPVGTAHD